MLPALRELSLGWRFDEQSVEAAARAFGRQLDTLHWGGRVPDDRRLMSYPTSRLPPGGAIDALKKPLVAGASHIGAHVDGEFIVGMLPPWVRRPLEFGDDRRGPWFEGGSIAIKSVEGL